MTNLPDPASPDHDDPLALHAQGVELWHSATPARALDAFRRAVAALPPDAPATTQVQLRMDLALCLRDQGGDNLRAALDLYPQIETLCLEAGIDSTGLRRQWAVALETDRQLPAARALYEKIQPAPDAPALERLLWHHAVALLDWSDGRLVSAAGHLALAGAQLPEPPEEAAPYLPVLGNAARLALLMGKPARAYRLAERMSEIRNSVDRMPLAGIVSLAIVQAALARQRGEPRHEARILKDCLDWIEENDPGEWPNRLDMLGRYAAAAQHAGASADALRYLSDVTAAAPAGLAWVGHLALAQLQLHRGEGADARRSLEAILAAIVGADTPEREVEIVALLAALAEGQNRPDAAIFLGKLALKYLARVARDTDGEQLRSLLDDSDALLRQTHRHLSDAGRFQEAAAIETLYDRIRREALLHHAAVAPGSMPPIPMDPREGEMESRWNAARGALAALREAERPAEEIAACAAHTLDELLAFTTSSGLDRRAALSPLSARPQATGHLRISLLPMGEKIELHYSWPDGEERLQHPLPARQFFGQIGALRQALCDPGRWIPPARQLHQLIIDPIAARLDHLERIEIDARGALGLIPMAALTDGTTCLVERVALQYLLSADPPVQPSRPRQGLAHLCALADGPLAGLAGTTRNIDLSGLAPLTQETGPVFTRDSLKAALARHPAVLSIAAHLDCEPTRPDLTALLLGDGSPLHLSELAGEAFDMSGLPLAIVAACSSAVADVTAPLDSSLAALLLAKGARQVMATLWDIPEGEAAGFLPAFWQILSSDPQMDPALALASWQADEARLALRNAGRRSLSGGIGSPSQAHTPDGWAAFAIFAGGNSLQPPA